MSVGETWPGSPEGTAEDCPWTPQQNDPGEQAACGSTGTLNPPRPTLKAAHVHGPMQRLSGSRESRGREYRLRRSAVARGDQILYLESEVPAQP